MKAALLFTLAGLSLAASACGKPAAPPADAGQVFKGSYAGSCTNISATGGFLYAECKSISGAEKPSRIQAGLCQGDIGNNDGVLVCNGATAIVAGDDPSAANVQTEAEADTSDANAQTGAAD